MFQEQFLSLGEGASVGADLFNLQDLLHPLQLKIITELLVTLFCLIQFMSCDSTMLTQFLMFSKKSIERLLRDKIV